MKLQSYQALCAAGVRDYCRVGEIMAEYFGIPELSSIARSMTPSIIKNFSHNCPRYSVTIVLGGRGYHWFSSLGFVLGSADYNLDKAAFDVVLSSLRLT